MFPIDDRELMCELLSVPTSFLRSVSSDTRHSITHGIPHGATLTVEVQSNLDDVFLLFLVISKQYQDTKSCGCSGITVMPRPAATWRASRISLFNFGSEVSP
jgi:hypothetical protein